MDAVLEQGGNFRCKMADKRIEFLRPGIVSTQQLVVVGRPHLTEIVYGSS
jgi:hypothetical protein